MQLPTSSVRPLWKSHRGLSSTNGRRHRARTDGTASPFIQQVSYGQCRHQKSLTSMIPRHAQFDCLSHIPKKMHVVKKAVNGAETSTALASIDLYLGAPNSIIHMGGTEPLIKVAKPMRKRPQTSCATEEHVCK